MTTVFDALCVGDLGYEKDRNRTYQEAVLDLDGLAGTGLLRIEHLLHLRCEVPAPDTADLLEAAADHALVREAKAAGAAIVLIAHDVAVRDAIADRVLTLTPLQDAA